MERWLAGHDELVTARIAAHGGRAFKHTGDGHCAVFAAAADAVRTAHDVQRALAAAGASRIGPLRARVAVHSGPARERGGDFYGPTLNRCARLLAVGHGGQVLLSQATVALLPDGAALGAGVILRDLGPHRLRDLQQPERIWQLTAPELCDAFPPLRSLDAFVHNLPLQRSSFVGREAEKVALRELVHQYRLVTVTGVGGCGKTRLALEVAAAELDRFADGVFLVELASLFDPTLVGSAIAAALRVPAGPGTGDERLREFLSNRRLLLVVDNCEHLLDGCGRILDLLSAQCPGVTLLATSREALGIEGERVWRVPSLGVPATDSVKEIARSECGRLFADRAAAVRPGFVLGADNAPAVAEICRRLDGIPLAIELAAARVSHLAPREIADRLSDRFALLTGGRRGVQRQQTLQAVLDWSHELLGESERMLLRRLAVFAGGWTLEAAQAVGAGGDLSPGRLIDLLGTLVGRSMVDAVDVGDHTRYRLLETVRLYAQERLVAAGEAAALRTAHAEWFLHAAEAAADGRDATQCGMWFAFPAAELDHVADLDNLREAADWWLARGRYDLALRVAAATINGFHAQGRLDEPEGWIAAVLAHGEDVPADLRSSAHAASAIGAVARGQFSAAVERARAAIALAPDPAQAGAAYSIVVGLMTWVDADEAERLLTDSSWTRGLGSFADDYLRAAHAAVANARSDYDRAIALLSEMRPASRLGPPHFQLVVAHLLRGSPTVAADLLADAQIRESWWDYSLPLARAWIAAARGDLATARTELGEALALVRRWNVPLGLADCGVGCATIAFHAGDAQRASTLLAAVRETGTGLRTPISMIVYRHYLRAVRAILTPEAVHEARAAGASLSLEAAIARELADVPPA